jgi:hypothetical protein
MKFDENGNRFFTDICFQNCFDNVWEKKYSTDREKLLKFKAEGREFSKILRSLQQFIQRSEFFFKQNAFFKLIPGGLSDLIH